MILNLFLVDSRRQGIYFMYSREIGSRAAAWLPIPFTEMFKSLLCNTQDHPDQDDNNDGQFVSLGIDSMRSLAISIDLVGRIGIKVSSIILSLSLLVYVHVTYYIDSN